MSEAPDEIESYRLERLAEMDRDERPGWRDRFRPGSFGHHELLDRASCVIQLAEEILRKHPACVMNPEFYAMADRAIAALVDLYQAVGRADLDEADDVSVDIGQF